MEKHFLGHRYFLHSVLPGGFVQTYVAKLQLLLKASHVSCFLLKSSWVYLLIKGDSLSLVYLCCKSWWVFFICRTSVIAFVSLINDPVRKRKDLMTRTWSIWYFYRKLPTFHNWEKKSSISKFKNQHYFHGNK